MDIQKMILFLFWLIVTFVGLIISSWLFKYLYCFLRSLAIVVCLACIDPLVMWEIMRSSFDELQEKIAPLVESVQGDAVYRTFDWFSLPVDWTLRIVSSRWCFLRNKNMYLRWLRMKRYLRSHPKREILHV